MQLLFVCSGNTCRSPLAAAIARREAETRGLTDVAVESAGVSAFDGTPASDGAILVAMERGLDVTGHRSRTLTRDLVAESDLILVMGPHHKDRVTALGGGEKVHLLTSYATHGASCGPVADPFGGDLAEYRQTCDELEEQIRGIFDRLVTERGTGRE